MKNNHFNVKFFKVQGHMRNMLSSYHHFYYYYIYYSFPFAILLCTCQQEGLLWRVHRLSDPLHRPAHAALDRPRRQTSVLHRSRPGKVRPRSLPFHLTEVRGRNRKSSLAVPPRQVPVAHRLPADQPACSRGLLPEHRVPAVQQREGLHDGPCSS